MAVYAGPGCAWGGPSCSPKSAFTSTWPWRRSANVSRCLRTCLHLLLPASCLLGSVTKIPCGGIRRMWVAFLCVCGGGGEVGRDCHSDFKESVGVILYPRATQLKLSEILPWPQQSRAPSSEVSEASRAQRLGLPEAERIFLPNLLRGETPVRFTGK